MTKQKEWSSGRTSILITTYEHIKKAGLYKPSRYKMVSYDELIKEFKKIEVDAQRIWSLRYPLLIGQKQAIKQQRYLIPVTVTVENLEQILEPAYNTNPLREEDGDLPIEIGKSNIFKEFTSLYENISYEKSIQEIICQLTQPITNRDEFESKIIEWVNKYGLPLSSVTSNLPFIPNLLKEGLYRSDILVQSLQIEYERIPFFMTLESIAVLYRYCLWLDFASWLYKCDYVKECNNKNKKISPHDKEYQRTNEEIQEGYLGFLKAMRESPTRKIFEESEDLEIRRIIEQEIKYPHIKERHGVPELINQLTQWISFSIVVDHVGGDGFSNAKYHCSSLMGIMALEQFSFLMNRTSYNKTCAYEDCIEGEGRTRNRFLSNKRRADARYCSEECQDRAADQRENERRRLKRGKK